MKTTFKRFKVRGLTELDDIRTIVALLHIYFEIKIGAVQFFGPGALTAMVILGQSHFVASTYPERDCTIMEIESCSRVAPARRVMKYIQAICRGQTDRFRINLYSPIAGTERGEPHIVAQACGWDRIKIVRDPPMDPNLFQEKK